VHKLHLIPPLVLVLKRVHYYATLVDVSKRIFLPPPRFPLFFWLGKSRTHSAVHQAACVFCQGSSAYSSL